jgi:hypothetical protein
MAGCVNRPTPLKRAQSLFIDLVLVGAAVAYASAEVEAWLIEHQRALLYLLSALHLFMLWMLTMVQLQAVGSKDLGEERPMTRLFIWSFVLYLGAGFIVPGVLGMTVKAELPLMMGTIFGPYLVAGLLVWGWIRLDARLDHRYSRQGAELPRPFRLALTFCCWLYLLCMEAMLMVASDSPQAMGGGFTLGAAIVGYLPVRLCIAVGQRAGAIDLGAIAFAFLHLLYRLAA